MAFTYERMPLHCYLCGLVGHLEKRCPSCFNDDFVDPGSEFPFGEWLKAGEVGGTSHLPLQPLQSPTVRPRPTPVRGLQIFEFESQDSQRPFNNKENVSLGGGANHYAAGSSNSLVSIN